MRRPASNKLTGRPIDQVPMLFIFLSGSIAAHYQEPTAVLQEWLQERPILFLSRNDFANYSFIICRVSLHLDCVLDMSSPYPNFGQDTSNATLHLFFFFFIYMFTYSQPACLEKTCWNRPPAIWVTEICAHINSCGCYKQSTWSLSKSPTPQLPSLHLFLCPSSSLPYLEFHFVPWLSKTGFKD